MDKIFKNRSGNVAVIGALLGLLGFMSFIGYRVWYENSFIQNTPVGVGGSVEEELIEDEPIEVEDLKLTENEISLEGKILNGIQRDMCIIVGYTDDKEPQPINDCNHGDRLNTYLIKKHKQCKDVDKEGKCQMLFNGTFTKETVIREINKKLQSDEIKYEDWFYKL